MLEGAFADLGGLAKKTQLLLRKVELVGLAEKRLLVLDRQGQLELALGLSIQ